MKIVHVLPALTKGGGERVAVELANAAFRAGNQVTLITGYKTDPTLLQDQVETGVKLIFIAKSSRSRYSTLVPWIIKHKKFLQEQDIIHCHLTYGSGFGSFVQLLFKFLSSRPKVVETYHAVGMPIPKFNRALHALLASMRDGVVFMAEDKYWRKFISGHPNLLTTIIPNGLSINKKRSWDSASIENYKQKIGIPSNCKLVIGTVGMLRPDRQPWKYISIFSKLIKLAGEDVHFVIAGGGPLLEELRTEVKRIGFEKNIHLPGLVTDPSLPFSIMDIYISLNVGSITGISVLEASLAKLPVVCIQLLENYKASDKDWVWSSNDENKIVHKLVEMINSKDLREKTAIEQNKYVRENLSTEVMVDSYCKFYKAVLGASESVS